MSQTAHNKDILLITGDEPIQTFTYNKLNHGYWSAAFEQILEKRGILSFDKSPPSVLEDASFLDNYSSIIITWLPDHFWKQHYLDNLLKFSGSIFIEGPLPEHLEERLQIKRIQVVQQDEHKLSMRDPFLNSFISDYYSLYLDKGNIPLRRKIVLQSNSRENRWDPDFNKSAISFDELHYRLIKAFYIPYVERIKNGRDYPSALQSFLMLYYVLSNNERNLTFGRILDRETILKFIKKTLLKIQTTEDLLSLGLLSSFLLPNEQNEICLQLEGNRKKNNSLSNVLIKKLQAFSKDKAKLSYAANLVKQILLDNSPLQTNFNFQRSNNHLKEAINPFKKNNNSPIATIKNSALFFQSIIALNKLGEYEVTKDLLSQIYDYCLDYETGTILWGKKSLLLESEYLNIDFTSFKDKSTTSITSPLLALAISTYPNKFSPEMSVAEKIKQQYAQSHVDKWSNQPYQVEVYASKDLNVDPLITLEQSNEIVIGQRDNIYFSSFQIFSYIAYNHTMPPLKRPFADCNAFGSICLEAIVFYICRNFFSNQKSLLEIAPWPNKYKYCFTVRHDVDRLPTREAFDAITQFESKNNLGVSWYWIFSRLCSDYIKKQEELNHEVALHSLKHHRKKLERKTISKELTIQKEIQGEFTHGGGGGEYWLGYHTVKSDAEEGLSYTEGVATIYSLPYQFPYLEETGVISYLEPIALSHVSSIDTCTYEIEQYNSLEELGKKEFRFNRLLNQINTEHYVMILHHPDRPLKNLSGLVNLLPKSGRLNWTAAQVAQWWKITHLRKNLHIVKSICSNDYTQYIFNSVYKINELTCRYRNHFENLNYYISSGDKIYLNNVKLSNYNGSFIEFSLNLNPGENTTVSISTELNKEEKIIDLRQPANTAVLVGNKFNTMDILQRLKKFVDLGEEIRPCFFSNSSRHLDENCIDTTIPNMFADKLYPFKKTFILKEYPTLFQNNFSISIILSYLKNKDNHVYIEAKDNTLKFNPGKINLDFLKDKLSFFPIEIKTKGNWIDLCSKENLQITENEIPSIYNHFANNYGIFHKIYCQATNQDHITIPDLYGNAAITFIYSMFGANQKSFILSKIHQFFNLPSPHKCTGLDVGGGWGFLGAELALQGYTLTVADYDKKKTDIVGPWLAKHCRVEDRLSFVNLTMEQLNNINGQYDFISFFGSLLYAQKNQISRILEGCMKMLNTGGLLLIHENPKEKGVPGTLDYEKRFEANTLHNLLLENCGTPQYFSVFSGEKIPKEKAHTSVIMAAVQKI